MLYIILSVQALVLGLIVTFAIRWFRATPEKRREMVRPKKRTIFVVGGLVLAGLIAGSAVMFSALGVTGIRVTSAAKDYLRRQYSATDTWEISLAEHVERSKEPRSGSYRLRYRYGERKGDLVAEYFERDGELVVEISPESR